MTSSSIDAAKAPQDKITIRMGSFFADGMVEYGSTFYHLYRDIPGFAGGIGNNEDEMGGVYTIVLYRIEVELLHGWAGYVAFARLARLHGEPSDGDEGGDEDFRLTAEEAVTLCDPDCLLCHRIGLPTCCQLLTYDDSKMRERVRQFFAATSEVESHV